jgi:hypothetical protein
MKICFWLRGQPVTMEITIRINLHVMRDQPDLSKQDHPGLVIHVRNVLKRNLMHPQLDMLIIMILSLHITTTIIMEEMLLWL